MSYVPGTIKWGGDIGTPSDGPVTWSANYFDALTVDPDFNEADFDAALQQAFDRWENVAAIDFEFDGSGAATDITVGSTNLGAGVAGLASIEFGGSEIFDVDVFIATNQEWSPFGTGAPDFYLDFYAVALHEIGHAIGLEHVPDTGEIMNATIFASELGNGDIAAAQYLYDRDPGDAPLADAEVVEPEDDNRDGGDGGGGGGGPIAILLGVLALVFGFGPVGGVALAAGIPNKSDDDDDGDTVADVAGDFPDLSELFPTVAVTENHYLYVPGAGGHTGLAGCSCSECHQQQMEDEESDFLI